MNGGVRRRSNLWKVLLLYTVYKLNLCGTSKSTFHKFYIDYCINIISTNFLKTCQYIGNFLDLNLLNLLGPRSLEKGSYHSNRLYNLLYSGNLVSLLGGVFVIGVLLVVIVVIKGIIIACFSFIYCYYI